MKVVGESGGGGPLTASASRRGDFIGFVLIGFGRGIDPLGWLARAKAVM